MAGLFTFSRIELNLSFDPKIIFAKLSGIGYASNEKTINSRTHVSVYK
jgi:hypothetical protein